MSRTFHGSRDARRSERATARRRRLAANTREMLTRVREYETNGAR
jgi:hypothetical protein